MPSERVAVVTGAGRGIGRVAALALAEDDWTVVLAGRNALPLEDVASTITAGGGSAFARAADVTRPTDVAALFDFVKRRLGRLDLLFNNAGSFAPPTAFDALTVDQWNTVVEVNLNGAFYCAQAAYRMMKNQAPQGGRIINNGSVSAHSPRPNSAPYTATKHAITGLTKSIALDGRAFNIACGQIDIGNAATDMTQRMQEGVLQANGTVAAEPVIDATHVASCIRYMASLPLEANVLFMTVMASAMPLVGRG